MKAPARYQLPERTAGFGTHITLLKHDEDDWTGALLAWDPVAQRARWSVPRDKLWNGGVVSTAGNLVFQGDANGIFHAYDARNGASLWSFDAKLGIIAAPITYRIDGRQYVSILVGFGGALAPQVPFINYGWKYGAQPRRLLTFSLSGGAQLPATPPRDFTVKPVDDPKLVIDEAAATRGAGLYASNGCVGCHGDHAKAEGTAPAPDLRESGVGLYYPAFATFLHSGARVQHGMPKFGEISAEQARDIFMFIRAVARDTLKGTTRSKAMDGSIFQ
jgi:quinohemoprotein ethanol dehydrogenase